ncbi:hypothetical protein BJV82DRAFT_322483 [Fennellomyces sp. T-0311]|nr:hypothetical protein BJV82DRAFT_322483 [Fennellomyces sp. T-0311]
MCQFVPLRHFLVDSIGQHLPPPVDAQRYRSNILLEPSNRYYGGKINTLQKGLATSDPNGPLLIYIHKIVILISGHSLAYFPAL